MRKNSRICKTTIMKCKTALPKLTSLDNSNKYFIFGQLLKQEQKVKKAKKNS